MFKRLAASPIARISFGLMLLTISILLVGDIFFRFGDQKSQSVLSQRKQLCESLAVQFSVLLSQGNEKALASTLDTVVRRRSDLLSAALRSESGEIIVEAGVHGRYWKRLTSDKSTATNAQVPIFSGSNRWGQLEMRFSKLDNGGYANVLQDPFVQFVLFVAIMGFVGYLLFMKRTLRHLDPAAVIPDRVKTALDVLAEGVVLVNESSEIVLANQAFNRKLGNSDGSLLGTNLSDMSWHDLENKRRAQDLPWQYALERGESALAVPLSLDIASHGLRTFIVNGSPILDDGGNPRGAMVTFDDVTELQQKNEELRLTLESLEASEQKIRHQNEKLVILATRDPLTSCLNRRSFNEQCEQLLEAAEREGTPLSCIMMDIDHFKSVNDNFGHSVGDQVIKQVVNSCRSGLRSIDIMGRYGGEEFSILLPGLDLDDACVVAGRLRSRIEKEARSALTGGADRIVTSSFGVASTEYCPFATAKLLDAADKALYASKNNGRNRVSRVDELEQDQVA